MLSLIYIRSTLALIVKSRLYLAAIIYIINRQYIERDNIIFKVVILKILVKIALIAI